MKRTCSIPLAAAGLLLVLGLSNCKKEQQAAPQNYDATERSHPETFASIKASNEDRIDAIVKDLAVGSYSLSFDKSIPAAGITKTSYGAVSSYELADPGIMICPDLFRKIQKVIPVPKWPTFVLPTCPTMVPYEDLAKSLQQFLLQADPVKFKGLQGIKTYSGNIILGNETFKKKYTALKADKIDDALKGIDPEKFVLLNDPAASNGILTRDFYGYADLNRNVFGPYKKSLKDLLIFPKVIGCFDPVILKTIREKIQTISPTLTKKLGVTPLADARNVAVLSF